MLEILGAWDTDPMENRKSGDKFPLKLAIEPPAHGNTLDPLKTLDPHAHTRKCIVNIAIVHGCILLDPLYYL